MLGVLPNKKHGIYIYIYIGIYIYIYIYIAAQHSCFLRSVDDDTGKIPQTQALRVRARREGALRRNAVVHS